MGRILKLFNNIKSSKRWRRNSDLYQDVVNTMQSYTEQMDKPVTEESAKKLYNISKALKNKADLYLASRKNPRTSKGKARFSMIQEIANLNSMPDELRDPIKVEALRKDGKKLSDIVDEVRNNNAVDITNQANKKVYGAGASKRVRFDYMGRNGFFTGKQKVEDITVVVARERERLEKEKKAIFERMKASGMLRAAETPSIVENKSTQQIISSLATTVGKEISDFNEEEIRAIVDYHKEISKANNMQETAMETAGIVADSEVSKRNVATSRMAHMLQMGQNVAFSENVTVIDNGVKMEGSFMAAAVGYDSRSEAGMEFMADKEFDFTAPSLQRDINRMQVFDMLCGQIDRHGGNFFYQVAPNPVNGKYVITGLQGIDNDMSFGNTNLNRWRGQMTPIRELNAIDEDVLQSLRELTPEQIEYTMGDLLSKQEVDAVIERRNQILEHVDAGKAKIVKSDEWGEKTIPLMEESSYYKEIKKEVSLSKVSLEQKHDAIVDDYDDAVKRIEEYNEKHPEDEQELPIKPEHYDEYRLDRGRRQMEALKEKYEKTMTDFEAEARQAAKEGKPMPKVPEGYEYYRKDRENKEMMEMAKETTERKEISLDELSGSPTQVTRMTPATPSKVKEMEGLNK